MNLTETEQFKQMIEQHNELFEMVSELKDAVVGNREYERKGVIQEIREIKNKIETHDEEDEKKFDKIFEYQKKQQYFVGWSGIALQALWSLLLIAITYYATK